MSVHGGSGRDRVGVCYLTAVHSPGATAEELIVRVVSTSDVASPKTTAQHVVGVDAAAETVRLWLVGLCLPSVGGDDPAGAAARPGPVEVDGQTEIGTNLRLNHTIRSDTP